MNRSIPGQKRITNSNSFQTKIKVSGKTKAKAGPYEQKSKEWSLHRIWFGILTTGLGPRRTSRERINQKTAKKARSQDSLDNLTVKQQPSRGRQPHKMSRSKENLNKSKSRENLDRKSNQFFAGEFVDFYMGKLKAWLNGHVKKLYPYFY